MRAVWPLAPYLHYPLAPAAAGVFSWLEWRMMRTDVLSVVAGPPPGLVKLMPSITDPRTPTTRKVVTPLNRKPGGLMEQSNASLQRGDQG
jgi:hypothetical protein